MPKAAAKEKLRRHENAKKAQKAAERLFPGEMWIPAEGEEHIYISSRRARGENSSYEKELRDAKILRDLGGTVYLVPEQRNKEGKKYDAIVNGMKMEFKDITGGRSALFHRFLESREQAPNVFINLEKSNLTKREILSTLYGARNKPGEKDSPGIWIIINFPADRLS